METDGFQADTEDEEEDCVYINTESGELVRIDLSSKSAAYAPSALFCSTKICIIQNDKFHRFAAT